MESPSKARENGNSRNNKSPEKSKTDAQSYGNTMIW